MNACVWEIQDRISEVLGLVCLPEGKTGTHSKELLAFDLALLRYRRLKNSALYRRNYLAIQSHLLLVAQASPKKIARAHPSHHRPDRFRGRREPASASYQLAA
jgi:hypothetical protein